VVSGPDERTSRWIPRPVPGDGQPEVVLLGEALVAFLAVDGLPLRDAVSYRRTVVGAEFNVAAGLTRLGHPVLFCGRTGQDALGQVVRDAARGRGVRLHGATDPAPTAVLVRDLSGDRPMEVAYARSGSAGSRLSVDDLPGPALEHARLLHVSGITATLSATAHEATVGAVEQLRSHDGAVSFDPNVRRRLMDPTQARLQMLPLVDHATILLTGADELAWLSDRSSPADGAAWAIDRGVAVVVVKDGVRGAWASDGVSTWSAPALPVRAVDPVGAGDGFAAGFLSGLLRGTDPGRAMVEAAAVAAHVVATPGDVEGLPDRRLLDRLLGATDQVHR
jgi:2-dehydro-3-deoxygluconokinase